MDRVGAIYVRLMEISPDSRAVIYSDGDWWHYGGKEPVIEGFDYADCFAPNSPETITVRVGDNVVTSLKDDGMPKVKAMPGHKT